MRNLIVDNWEIEHRYLLKRLPKEAPLYSIDIVQYYYPLKNGGRVRKEVRSDTKEVKYLHTVKTFVKPGISEEIEDEITESEFVGYVNKSEGSIFKTRYIYKHQNKKWEVDKFTHYALIIAEIELKYENELYQIPDYILDELLIEVTGNHKFSNYSLSQSR